MKTYRLGGYASILTGLSYLFIAVTFFLLPPEQRAGQVLSGPFFISVAENALFLKIQLLLFALNAILAIAVVQALSKWMNNHKMIQWSSTLAVIGYAILIYINFYAFEQIPRLAEAYIRLDFPLRTIITAFGIGFDDWMAFILTGLWMFVINWYGLLEHKFPKTLAILGMFGGLCNFLIAAGSVLKSSFIMMAAAGLGGVMIGPVWFIWTGKILLHEKEVTIEKQL